MICHANAFLPRVGLAQVLPPGEPTLHLPLAWGLAFLAVTALAVLIGRRLERRATAARLADAGIAEVEIDANGTVRRWSTGGERVFGHAAAEIVGRNVALLMPSAIAAEHDGYLQRRARSAQASGESRIFGCARQVVGVHRDGHELPLLLWVRPLLRRGGVRFEGLLQALPAAGARPEHALSEDVTPRLQWRWLRNLGHEIRTPMAAIQCHAEILTDEHSGTAERAASADAILRNSRHLHELLDDLLDHARLAAGEMPVHPTSVELRQLLDDAASMLRPLAEHKGLRLQVEVDGRLPATLRTDPLRLRQILLNLLGNALKFTRAGWVRVEATLGERDGGARVLLDVCDTGPGIGRDFAPSLFQPFQQEARVQSGPTGSGLGLSICRRMARLLGGDLSLVDSVPGAGSRFRLELPLETNEGAEPAAAAPRPPAAAAQLAGTTVLLVDDADDLRRAFGKFLEAAGASVVPFRDPTEALARCAAGELRFDLAVLDLMMPEMTGYELARHLRALEVTAPLVALSADADPEADVRCRAAGFDLRLSKPILRRDLVGALAAALAQHVGAAT